MNSDIQGTAQKAPAQPPQVRKRWWGAGERRLTLGLVSRITGVVTRAMADPAKEYRRLKWRCGLSRFQQLPEGVGIYVYPREDVSEHLHYGDFEPAVRQVVRAVLRPGMTFVDAGANLGLYTVIAAKLVGPTGRVFAFEPSQREWRRAMRTVRRNGLRNVQLYQAALGDVNGTVSLTVCDAAYGAFNSIGRVSHHSALGHESYVEEVPCRALDSFLEENGVERVDVIKLDVEGAEERVLRGGHKLFSGAGAPIVFCELSDWTAVGTGSSAARVWDLLSSYGYGLYSIIRTDDGYRLGSCDRRARIEYEDVLALKPAQMHTLRRKLQFPEAPAQLPSAPDLDAHA